jgi:hypothetical protein
MSIFLEIKRLIVTTPESAAKFVQIENADHFLNLEKPIEFNNRKLHEKTDRPCNRYDCLSIKKWGFRA